MVPWFGTGSRDLGPVLGGGDRHELSGTERNWTVSNTSLCLVLLWVRIGSLSGENYYKYGH